MMKNLFTSIGIFISLALLAQQSLSLSYAGGLLNPNDTIVVYGDSGLYTTIVIHIYVTNQTNQNLPVKVKKAEIQIVPGSENTFCWGQCYIPTVYVSPDAITIPAHTTDDHSFWGEYKPMGHLGVSTIRYTFFVSDNPSDSVAVYVKYIATPVGINEIAKNKPILYLNDTGQWLYISHETQMESLIFYFSNGQYVGKYPVSVFPLYVGNWNSGVYYYRISDGKSFSFTGKLVMIR